MLDIVTEDEELDLLEELDEFDDDADYTVREMTDRVKFELDN